MQRDFSVWVVEAGRLARRRVQPVSSADGTIVTLPFDIGEGIVVSALNDPQEGDAVTVSATTLVEGAQP